MHFTIWACSLKLQAQVRSFQAPSYVKCDSDIQPNSWFFCSDEEKVSHSTCNFDSSGCAGCLTYKQQLCGCWNKNSVSVSRMFITGTQCKLDWLNCLVKHQPFCKTHVAVLLHSMFLGAWVHHAAAKAGLQQPKEYECDAYLNLYSRFEHSLQVVGGKGGTQIWVMGEALQVFKSGKLQMPLQDCMN